MLRNLKIRFLKKSENMHIGNMNIVNTKKSLASEPLEREDVQNLLLKMEEIKDAIVETIESANEAIVETAKEVKDCCDEKIEDFKEAVIEAEASLVKNVEKMKEMEKEEMVELVKPRLRRETFENSLMLSRVGGRQFLLVLLVIAQVIIKMVMLQQRRC